MDIDFQLPDSIEFSPSGLDFSQRIDATITDFVNMLKMVGTLISSDRFKRYTQPVINGRQDTIEINEGFDIVGLIEWNDEYDQVRIAPSRPVPPILLDEERLAAMTGGRGDQNVV